MALDSHSRGCFHVLGMEEIIGTDWIATVKEQGELTKKLSVEVPRVLANPGLTFEKASQLHRWSKSPHKTSTASWKT